MLTMRASGFSRTMPAEAASISRLVLALRTLICILTARAAVSTSLAVTSTIAASVGLTSTATRVARAPRSEHEHVPEQADAERQSGTNPKTAARLSPILKMKNNEAGDGLAPDQRHEQIGANQHDGIVDDLASTARRPESFRAIRSSHGRLCLFGRHRYIGGRLKYVSKLIGDESTHAQRQTLCQ